jgi:putative holliday junction resolvase
MTRPRVLLGFDFGTKRIGVAVGQQLTGTARALTTLRNRDGAPDWEAIGKLLATWQPDALVVGLPLNLDGSDHAITRLARRFGNRLRGRYNLPVFTIDERLSSAEAERLLAEQGRFDKADVDKLAARLILESWLTQNAPSHDTEHA